MAASRLETGSLGRNRHPFAISNQNAGLRLNRKRTKVIRSPGHPPPPARDDPCRFRWTASSRHHAMPRPTQAEAAASTPRRGNLKFFVRPADIWDLRRYEGSGTPPELTYRCRGTSSGRHLDDSTAQRVRRCSRHLESVAAGRQTEAIGGTVESQDGPHSRFRNSRFASKPTEAATKAPIRREFLLLKPIFTSIMLLRFRKTRGRVS